MRAGPDIVARRIGRVTWRIRRDSADQVAGVLQDPDAALARADRIFRTTLVSVGRVPADGPARPAVVLRRLNYSRLRHRLRDMLRPTRVQRAFANGLRLERAGVATPRVLAVGTQRVLSWPRRAYLVTEWVPGAQTLSEYLAEHGSIAPHLTRRLAALLARLHAGGFSHRDLKASNVLFDQHGEPWLIDLDGVRGYARLPQSRAVADLSRLARELRDYPSTLKWEGARFLKEYWEQRGLPGDWSAWTLPILEGAR